MAIINASYEVLSDPVQRKQHDIWIAEQELKQTQHNNPQPKPQSNSAPKTTIKSTSSGSALSHVLRHWFIYSIACFAIWGSLTQEHSPPPPGPKPYIAEPAPEIAPPANVEEKAPAKPAYERSLFAPNGQVWPSTAGYVQGYKKLNIHGLSTVTVDNTQNDSDVFVKLVSLDKAEAYPIRQFFIPAFGKFTVNKVNAGKYDVRYRDLDSGGLSRSESFGLEEVEEAEGTRFSNFTMTLYKVRDGNMQTYALAEEEF